MMNEIMMNEIDNKTLKELEEISQKIYTKLGSGHSEFIYHRALEIELRNKGIKYETEKKVIITYVADDGISYSLGEERIDIYIYQQDYQIIVELKAIIGVPRETELAQMYKYGRELPTAKYGIIINFPQAGVKIANDKIHFIVIEY